jgi:hypothetical protein
MHPKKAHGQKEMNYPEDVTPAGPMIQLFLALVL